jgi:hypothetical protein
VLLLIFLGQLAGLFAPDRIDDRAGEAAVVGRVNSEVVFRDYLNGVAAPKFQI